MRGLESLCKIPSEHTECFLEIPAMPVKPFKNSPSWSLGFPWSNRRSQQKLEREFSESRMQGFDFVVGDRLSSDTFSVHALSTSFGFTVSCRGGIRALSPTPPRTLPARLATHNRSTELRRGKFRNTFNWFVSSC